MDLQTAAQFPMRCDGNLLPPAGKGEPMQFHWAALVTAGIDLDIDSDNNSKEGVFGGPDHTPEEDKWEDADKNDKEVKLHGKFIPVNDGDADNDQIPGFADGFGKFGDDSKTSGGQFVKAVLDISTVKEIIDWGNAKFRFTYSSSAPNTPKEKPLDNDPKKKYDMPEDGMIRIWTKDASEIRNPKFVDAKGDFIPGKNKEGDGGYEFPAKKLFDPTGKMEKTLYIEGIGKGTTNGLIKVEFSPKGDTTWMPDEVKVTVVKVDLDIIKPDGSELDDDKEVSEGEVVNVNIDDDDKDGGNGSHGKTKITSDKDDTNGVVGEDDLIQLKLHKIDIPAFKGNFKLEYNNKKIAIWKNKDKTGEVESDITTFDNITDDTFVYVEGKSPHGNTDGDIIKLVLYNDKGVILGSDEVKIIVADMIFCLYGLGPVKNGKAALVSYLVGKAKDSRPNTYILHGGSRNNLYYSVNIWDTEKYAKIALASDAYVAFSGHSNFGMGFAFGDENKITKINDIMNLGCELVAIDWKYLKMDQKYPKFTVDYKDYGDDPKTTETTYDPWRRDQVFRGTKPHLAAIYYSHPVANGTHYNLISLPGTPADRYKNDSHFTLGSEKYLIVKCGSADMPKKKWRKILLDSCESGRYYYSTFDSGTLFFTTNSINDTPAVKIFVEGIVNGSNDKKILKSLNDYLDPRYKSLFDYR